ncbi:DNA-binding protein [Mucilaginibacter gilvus]|uniref:DNA-binding protein n=2 Tax=Mucilaginibacter gilvus TaxID=2305909 RepID=A0A444MRX1_9SPHI|nr:DNA-binding protein [Mucilaginibacter gilvus]
MFTGLSLGDLKDFFTEIFEEQFGRKLESGSEFYFNGLPIGNGKKSNPAPKDTTVYLTRGEVSKQLQISLPTLHNYTKEGLIKSYRMGGKVRYKAEEIELALTERNFNAVNRKGGNRAA